MDRAVAEIGEVRVDVRLTNLVDAELAARGDLPEDEIRSVVCDAMVDTSAVHSALPKHVVDKLGLRVHGTRRVQLANGKSQESRSPTAWFSS